MSKKKIIIIMVAFIFVLLITAELSANLCYDAMSDRQRLSFKNLKFSPYKKLYPFNPKKEFKYGPDKTFEGKNDKGAVSVVICSATTGVGLKREETFAARLNQLTGRKIYSRALASRHTAHVYYQLSHNIIPKDTEYLIYFYLPHHRLLLHFDELPEKNDFVQNLKYTEDSNGKLKQNNSNWVLNHFYIVKLYNLKKRFRATSEEDKTQHLLTLVLKNCVWELKKSYPDTKFVIVKFQVFDYDSTYLNPELEKFLSDNGVIVLDAEKLTGEKYYLPKNKLADEKTHPNADVWIKLTPEIVKALNL